MTGGGGDIDYFEIAPDPTSPLIFKYTSIQGKDNVRLSSMASYFKNRELMKSETLEMIWRVAYSHDDQDWGSWK